jgi:hypothetical protein
VRKMEDYDYEDEEADEEVKEIRTVDVMMPSNFTTMRSRRDETI